MTPEFPSWLSLESARLVQEMLDAIDSLKSPAAPEADCRNAVLVEVEEALVLVLRRHSLATERREITR